MITNCETCNLYKLCKKYCGEFICDNCISLVGKIAVKSKLSGIKLLNQLRIEINHGNHKHETYS